MRRLPSLTIGVLRGDDATAGRTKVIAPAGFIEEAAGAKVSPSEESPQP